MSIDPENHPIEEKIVALVFELNCFRVYSPYWSCEGHTFPNGDLFRIPQVWFYSRSLVYPQLLNDYLHELYCSKKIKYMWQVRFNWTDDSENLEAGFTLEPNLSDVKNPQLMFMQNDAKTISQNLQSGLRNMAIKYIGMLKGYGAAANA